MTARVAVKRLAEVETDPAASHQHEFNAGKLRRELGFGEDRASGILDVLYYVADDRAPIYQEQQYTLYNSREKKPRSPEWRLYYTSSAIADHAQAGDLMLLFRPHSRANRLIAVVARSGTRVERALSQEVIGKTSSRILDPLFVNSPRLTAAGIQAVLRPFERPETTESPPFDYATHPLVARSLRAGALPTTAEMASAAQKIVAIAYPKGLAPDEYIEESLAAESRLFFTIERAIGNKELNDLSKRKDLDFARMMALATRYSQARRSRRGESLQNHFAALLDHRGIPYTPQCWTEKGERPDFIIPGKTQYHNPKYPEELLRMVGCKTKLRERYRQLLPEARRIRVKFGLCLDEDLSDEVITKYRMELRFFLPRRVLERAYRGRRTKPLLGSVAELIADLESVTVRMA